jgi:hypothetical protein
MNNEIDYVTELMKVVGGCYFLYRGYNARVLDDGSLVLGDSYFPDKQSFRIAIDALCEERYKSLAKSIEHTEKLLNK